MQGNDLLRNFKKKQNLELLIFSKEQQIRNRFQQSTKGQVKLSWLKINHLNIKCISQAKQQFQTEKIINELYLQFNQLGPSGMLVLSKVQWINLRLLNLASNKISPKGAQYLTKGNWPHIQSLGLMANQLMSQGIRHLQKGQWKELNILNIYWKLGIEIFDTWRLAENDLGRFKDFNKISEQGIGSLRKTIWPQIYSLSLYIEKRHEKLKCTIETQFRQQFQEIDQIQISFY